MKSFDFADIERVNRIELKPGEMVVFQHPGPLTAEVAEEFYIAFEGTPLQGRTLLLEGEWKLATFDPLEEE